MNKSSFAEASDDKSGKNWGGISSESVKAKTWKDWEEWIQVLDKEKAYLLPHKEIALLAGNKFGVGDWWCQMVTVGYEQAKGLREKHETKAGFSVSVSKTFEIPITGLYEWWSDEKKRKRWLKEKIVIHKASKNKSMRITWSDGNKSVSVNFYPKGTGKSQATVQHEKLKGAKAVLAIKKFWKESFSKLEAISK